MKVKRKAKEITTFGVVPYGSVFALKEQLYIKCIDIQISGSYYNAMCLEDGSFELVKNSSEVTEVNGTFVEE